MDSVVFDGKEYTKASVLALKFRYTSDYLGQLCRGKRVDARLVGRAWYINLDSLNKHRDSRYKSGSEEVSRVTVKKPSVNYLSRIDVEPVLKNKTVKIFKAKDGELSQLAVKYEVDENSLIPRVNKSAVSASLHVVPADADRLRVRKIEESKIINFKAELPDEAFLAGVLKVDGLPEATEVEADISNKIKTELEESKSVAKVISVRPREKIESKSLVDHRPVLVNREFVRKTTPNFQQKRVAVQVAPERKDIEPVKPANPAIVKPVASANIVKKQPTQIAPNSFKPNSVRQSETLVIPAATKSSWKYVMLALLLALLTSVTTLATNLEINVGEDFYTDRLTLQSANFADIFEKVFR